ncbi:hypothetical protein K523DRAFT_319220 [Schizophyllum commune Tattone D]|nr:hypothetical protein K523DRAFT_319220 [Schizophyllum commune Tattone D]
MSSSTLYTTPDPKDVSPPAVANLQPHAFALPRRRRQVFNLSSSGSESSRASSPSSHSSRPLTKDTNDAGHTPILVHRVPQPTQRVPQQSTRGYLQPHVSHLPRRPRRVARAPSAVSSSSSSCAPPPEQLQPPASLTTPQKPKDKAALQCIHTPQLHAHQGDQVYVAFCGDGAEEVILADWDRILHIHVADGANVTESHEQPPKSKVLSISPTSCNDDGVPNLSCEQIIEACAFLTGSDDRDNDARRRKLLVTAPDAAHAVDAMAVAVAVRFLDFVGARTPPKDSEGESETPREHRREPATHTSSDRSPSPTPPTQRPTPSFPLSTAPSPFQRYDKSPQAELDLNIEDHHSPIHAIVLAMQDLPPFALPEDDDADDNYFAQSPTPAPGMASMRAHANAQRGRPKGPVSLNRSISQVAGVPGVEVPDTQQRVEFVHQDAGKGVEPTKNLGLGLGVEINMNRSRIVSAGESERIAHLKAVAEESALNDVASESEGSSARAVAVDGGQSSGASSRSSAPAVAPPALSVQEVGTPSRDSASFASMTLKDQWRGVLSKEGMDYVWACVSSAHVV